VSGKTSPGANTTPTQGAGFLGPKFFTLAMSTFQRYIIQLYSYQNQMRRSAANILRSSGRSHPYSLIQGTRPPEFKLFNAFPRKTVIDLELL